MKKLFLQIMVLLIPVAMIAQPSADTENKISSFNQEKADVIRIGPSAKRNKVNCGNRLRERFLLFDEIADNVMYSITIAADVPDNKRPLKVIYKKEPGHVFIILEKKDSITGVTVAQCWGFYPIRPVSSLIMRTVKCDLKDNSERSYDAAIQQQLSKEQFDAVKSKAIALSAKKYNLNKYNCYDYAVELFNSIRGVNDLPLENIKFPFIFGRGGSPCVLYRQLNALKNSNSISFQVYIKESKAPMSSNYETVCIQKSALSLTSIK